MAVRKLTRLLEPFYKFMPVSCGPHLQDQRAIVEEFAETISKAAGVGVVETSEEELRDMHVECWSVMMMMMLIEGVIVAECNAAARRRWDQG